MLADIETCQRLRDDITCKRPVSSSWEFAATEIIDARVIRIVTRAADVWSMGAVFARLLTGGRPKAETNDRDGLYFLEHLPLEVLDAVKKIMRYLPCERICPHVLVDIRTKEVDPNKDKESGR